MNIQVLTLDGDEEIGEVSSVIELIDLLLEWGLTPDDIYLLPFNKELEQELLESWEEV